VKRKRSLLPNRSWSHEATSFIDEYVSLTEELLAMNNLKAAILAVAFTASAVVPSFAADGGREDGQGWLLNPGPAQTQPAAAAANTSRVVVNRPTTSYQVARDMNMSGT
jgi:hypothetical protein